MDAGNVAQWVAIGITAAGWAESRLAVWRGKDKQSAMAAALERIADAAERNRPGTPSRVIAESAPAAEWLIENPAKNVFVLRNVGTATATGVRVVTGHELTRDLPDGVTLGPMQSARFLLMSAWGHPLPDEVRVEWDGALPQSVPVRRWS